MLVMLVVSMAVIGIVVAVIVGLCAFGVIPRNGFAGIRIPAVTADDKSWRRGHRAAVVPTVIGAAVSVALAAVALAIPAAADWIGPVVLIAVAAGLAWGAGAAHRAAAG